jgi:hypothetical protein
VARCVGAPKPRPPAPARAQAGAGLVGREWAARGWWGTYLQMLLLPGLQFCFAACCALQVYIEICIHDRVPAGLLLCVAPIVEVEIDLVVGNAISLCGCVTCSCREQ